MHLYRPATIQEIQEAYRETAARDASLGSSSRDRQALTADMRIAYYGGQKAKARFLKMKAGETQTGWASRQQHAYNVGLAGVVINTHARLLYGEPPERTVYIGQKPMPFVAQIMAELGMQNEQNGAGMTLPDQMQADMMGAQADNQASDVAAENLNQDVQEWFQWTYDANHHRSLFLEAAIAWMRDGIAPMKIWLDDPDAEVPIRLDLLYPWDCWPIIDPSDRNVMLGVMEARRSGEYVDWRLWDGDAWYIVDDKLAVLADGGVHGLGRPPFAFLGDGCVAFPDLPDWQAFLINLASTRWAIARAQAHSIPVQAGKTLNAEQSGPTGERGIPLGMDRFIQLEEGGSLTFVKPQADFAELRSDYNSGLAAALYHHDLPPSTALDGAVAEQPTTVALRWLSALGRRDQIMPIAIGFEQAIMDIIARWVSEYLEPFNMAEFNSEVTFRNNPLPSDERQDQANDRLDVAAGLMLDEDYIIRHRLKGWPKDAVIAYVQALKKQAQPKPAPVSPFGNFGLAINRPALTSGGAP